MKRIITSIVLIGAILPAAIAQQTSDEATKNVDQGVLAQSDEKSEDGWKKGGTFAVNFGQVALSNWQGGGQSSVSGNSLMSLFANYKKGKRAWDNSLDLAYGLISQDNGPWIKSDDRIELNSKYGQQFKKNKKLYYGGLLNFRSQFAPGFGDATNTNVISRIMSPGYLTGAIGIDYKPNKSLSIFLAPVSYRGTFVLDDALNAVGAYGVDTNSTLRNELGGLFMAKYQKDVMKNVNLKTQLTLFSNYIESPQNIDVLWNVLISMKINKYISASISTTLIYDHDILLPLTATDDSGNEISFTGRRAQFKEVLNIGFSYKF
ncbi:MAG: DUF3078 domain-containing protein [Flavobacteriales bacterium]